VLRKIFRRISDLFISVNLDNHCTCSPTSINVHKHVCILIPSTHNRIYAQHTCAVPITPDCKAIVRRGWNIDPLEHHSSESITTFTQCVPFVISHFFLQHVTVGYLFLARQPPVGQGLLINEVSRSHTTMHHILSSGRVISLSQRPLPDNTQHSQQTKIHDPGGIRTHNLSGRAAAELRLRPRGHWEPHNT